MATNNDPRSPWMQNYSDFWGRPVTNTTGYSLNSTLNNTQPPAQTNVQPQTPTVNSGVQQKDLSQPAQPQGIPPLANTTANLDQLNQMGSTLPNMGSFLPAKQNPANLNNFQFSGDNLNRYQKNFNYLMQQGDPTAAYNYLLGGNIGQGTDAASTGLHQLLYQALPNQREDVARLINYYAGQGGSGPGGGYRAGAKIRGNTLSYTDLVKSADPLKKYERIARQYTLPY